MSGKLAPQYNTLKYMKSFDFTGKKVLIRVDFNVPQDKDLKVTDNTRIAAAMPTITKVLQAGGTVVLMSHLGRPKGERQDRMSLSYLVSEVEALSGSKVYFSSECVGDRAKAAVAQAGVGEIVLLENLRFHKEEEAGDEAFAKELAELGEIYLNDAFGTAHRAHASTAVIAKFFADDNKGFGELMSAEVDSISQALSSDKRTTVAIIGGAKVSSKLELLKTCLRRQVPL